MMREPLYRSEGQDRERGARAAVDFRRQAARKALCQRRSVARFSRDLKLFLSIQTGISPGRLLQPRALNRSAPATNDDKRGQEKNSTKKGGGVVAAGRSYRGAHPGHALPHSSSVSAALVSARAAASAVYFQTGDFDGSFNTTPSHGLKFRIQNTESDLEVRAGARSDFVRASGNVDYENENRSRQFISLTKAAKDLVGEDLDILDVYGTVSLGVGSAAAGIRLGKQVQ